MGDDIVQQELKVRVVSYDIAPVGSILVKDGSVGGRTYISKMPEEIFVGGGGGGVGHLAVDFDFNDVIIGKKSIGICPGSKMVTDCWLQIQEAFDDDTKITIGHEGAMGYLMTADDNFPDFPSIYTVDSCLSFLDTTELKVFFPSGQPTKGRGKVIIQIN